MPLLPVETVPYTAVGRPPTDDDPRLSELIGRDLATETWPAVALIGFPCDEGVRRNGGRVGAGEAPDRIRQWLYRLTPGRDPRLTALITRCRDFGNLRVDADLETAQARLGQAVAACLDHDTLPIVLGGGHETAYGHFLGYVEAQRVVSILNWDAHADVRPLVAGGGHSGSPFRQAIEHPSGLCRSYRVAGALPHATATAHVEYVAAHGGQIVWRDEVTAERTAALYRAAVERRRTDVERLGPGIVREPKAESREPNLLVSFDIDAVDQAFAPGVSAPATGGLTLEQWLHAARHAGRSPHVRSIDLVEMNPRLDRDDQTARLAALTVWTFLAGMAERSSEGSGLVTSPEGTRSRQGQTDDSEQRHT
jgi:formiminoglutamase